MTNTLRWAVGCQWLGFEALQLFNQRGALQAQDLRRLVLVSLSQLQRAKNQIPFVARYQRLKIQLRFLRRCDGNGGGLPRRREILRRQLGSVLRANHCDLDRVLQLSDVASPGAAAELLFRRRHEPLRRKAVAAAEPVEKVLDEQPDILGTIA